MAYLKLMSYENALEMMMERIVPIEDEREVPLDEAYNMISSREVSSPTQVPSYPKSQMDGYALKASDSFKATEEDPVPLKIIEALDAGMAPKKTIGIGECAYVATGAALPEGANSVVMIEDVILKEGEALVTRSLAPGENMMTVGFDIPKGGKVLSRGDVLTSRKVAALSGVGLSSTYVLRRPRVAILSTGSEIILPGGRSSYGKTYDVNGAFLVSECRRLGCETTFLGISNDNREELLEKIASAKGHDLLLVSAGVSKGNKDLMESTLSEVGEVVLHGINIKPGKPTLVSSLDGTLLVGLPGHPTSCAIIFTMLVLPLINKIRGSSYKFKSQNLKIEKRVVATKGRKQFLPVKVRGEYASPVFRGSGAISSFLHADGVAIIDENKEFLDADETVKVVMLDD